MVGDDTLSADVQAALINLTAQWNAATTQQDKDDIHRLANQYRSGEVKPTNQISSSGLQSDISTVLNGSNTSQLAKDIINKSILGTFNIASNDAKNSIVGGINNNIQGNRNQVIQAASLLDALGKTSNNLSTLQNQDSAWNSIMNTANPMFGSNMQSMVHGQMAGVESLLLSNSVVLGNQYMTYALLNSMLNGAPIDSRMVENLKKSLLSVKSYNAIYQEEKERKIKQTSSALLDVIPGVNSIKSTIEGLSGRDLLTGDNMSGWQRGFNVVLSILDLKAMKSLSALGKTTDSFGDILKQTDSAKWWGALDDGTNQGVKHFADYWDQFPERIPSLAGRLGVDPSSFAKTAEGFENFTNSALDIATNPASSIRNVGDKTLYYIDGVANSQKGVTVIVKDGRIQTMMPSDTKSFLKMK